MEHNKSSCDTCIGLDSCTRYCEVRVGESIVNFVNNLDCVETEIGSFRSDIKIPGGKLAMVTGFGLERTGNPIHIITAVPDTGLVIQGKMDNYLDMTPYQLLKAYTSHKGLSKLVQSKALDDLKRFNGNKMIPTPFKIGTDIEVLHRGFDGKLRKTTTNANLVKWCIDKDTGKLTGTILADVGRTEDGSQFIKLKLSEYGVCWFLPNIERSLKTSELTREAVKMNDIGLIHPLEVSDNKNTIAVDCQYMFVNHDGVDHIIGTWGPDGMVPNTEFTDTIKRTKVYKKVLSYLKFLEKHKRFIIPYGLTTPNRINL